MRNFLMFEGQDNTSSEVQYWQGLVLTSHLYYEDLRKWAPTQTQTVTITCHDDVDLYFRGEAVSNETILLTDLDESLAYELPSTSVHANDRYIQWAYKDAQDRTLGTIRLELTAIVMRLDVDADRDGVVEEHNPARGSWSWGNSGSGAILLVNSDRDGGGTRADRYGDRIDGVRDRRDLMPLVIHFEGPELMPPQYQFWLQVSDAAAEKIRIFDDRPATAGVLIGPGVPRANIHFEPGRLSLLAEGLRYPDGCFSGLITLTLLAQNGYQPTFQDKAVLRVAPWIMIPNTQRADSVYIARLPDGENANLIQQLATIVSGAGAQLVSVPPQVHRGDHWLQDEVEMGYSASPLQNMPVVLDSPRDRGLDIWPERALFGPDFGYVTRGATRPHNDLDSFGNLEVSPPVTVNETEYPLGRVLFGGAHPTADSGQRMSKMISDFLYAQLIQEPVELYSDWLQVGHVDEFVTFVPAATPKGFLCLLASPIRAYQLLAETRNQHDGSLRWLVGKHRLGRPVEVTIEAVLNDRNLAIANHRFQGDIDWNRDVLKRELGLSDDHIIDLPVLFFANANGSAEAYFPNMINMLVLGNDANDLVIPKPFGPRVREECIFEAFVTGQLHNHRCHYLDTWISYHQYVGEIHCGTQVKRHPLEQKWWQTKPPFAMDN